MKDVLAHLQFSHGPGFGDHGSRVATLALAMGRLLGLSSRDIEMLRFAAFIHDLGKTQVDPAILSKATALSDEEGKAVRNHPRLGYEQLTDLVHPSVAEAVLCHHESWDGSGYPEGLRKKEIPLMSRIILVADAFDVMTGERSYRLPIGISDAGSELTRAAGKQFDPDLVDIFASVDRAILEARVNMLPSP